MDATRVPAHPLLPRQGAGRAGGRARRRCETTVFAPSIVYDRGDPWITLLRALLVPAGDAGLRRRRGRATSRSGRATSAAAWSRRSSGAARRRPAATSWPARRRSPTTRSSSWSLRGDGRPRPLVHVPLPLVRAGPARRSARLRRAAVFATWEEAELMEVPMITERGTADAEAPGRRAAPDGEVLARGLSRRRPRGAALVASGAPAERPAPRLATLARDRARSCATASSCPRPGGVSPPSAGAHRPPSAAGGR